MSASSFPLGRSDSQIRQLPKSLDWSVEAPHAPVVSDEKLSSGVIRALELLKYRRSGSLDQAWNTVQLQTGDYDKLWSHLEKDQALYQYVTTKVKLDYDPKTLQLVVRMPLLVHEIIVESVTQEILSQLFTIGAGNTSVASLVQSIISSGSLDIFLQDGTKRCPDKQFIHDGVEYPGVVLEVAYSQSKKDGGKDLPKLADQYVVESSGNIKMVIGLAVDFRASKKATLSIWCPSFVADQGKRHLRAEQTVVFQEFRRADGTAVAGKTFCIPLKTFIPQPLWSNFLSEVLEQKIAISYEKLAAYLNMAEARDEMYKPKQCFKELLPSGTEKQRRESSPVEEPSSVDERRFEDLEAADAKRVEVRDGEWEKP